MVKAYFIPISSEFPPKRIEKEAFHVDLALDDDVDDLKDKIKDKLKLNAVRVGPTMWKVKKPPMVKGLTDAQVDELLFSVPDKGASDDNSKVQLLHGLDDIRELRLEEGKKLHFLAQFPDDIAAFVNLGSRTQYLRALCIDTTPRVIGDKFLYFKVAFFADDLVPTCVPDLLSSLRVASPDKFSKVGNTDIVIWKLKAQRPISYFTRTRTRSFAPAANSDLWDAEQVQNFINSFNLKTQAVKLVDQDMLKDHFPNPVLKDMVHIIVQFPAVVSLSAKQKRSIGQVDGPAKERPTKFSTLTRRTMYLREVTKELSKVRPSTQHAAEQINPQFLGGQPIDKFGFHVAVYHDTLAILRDELQVLDVNNPRAHDIFNNTSNADVIRARKYFENVANFQQNESARLNQIMEFWKEVFGSNCIYETTSSTSTDPCQVDVTWGEHSCVIMEVKAEKGMGGDASLQAVRNYIQLCRTLKEINPSLYARTNLPAILVGVMGNLLEVSIAVTLDIVHINKVLSFEIRSDDDYNEMAAKVVLIASALKKSANKLKEEYHYLKDLDNEDPVAKRKWYLPSVTPRVPAEVTFKLDFKSKLSRSNVTLSNMEYDQGAMTKNARSLFLADLHRNDSPGPALAHEVVVKLTTLYNQEAHDILASACCADASGTTGGELNTGNALSGSAQTLAPKLHGCYSFVGGGNLKLVVMDRVKGKPMVDYDDHTLPLSVFNDVKKAIELLHEVNLVFGDLRAPNIMVLEEEKHAMLIDFEWVAKEEGGRYPMMFNEDLANTELSAEARPLGPMKKEHDFWAFEKLFKKFCILFKPPGKEEV